MAQNEGNVQSQLTPTHEREGARMLDRVHAAGAGDARAQRWLLEAVMADVQGVARGLIGDPHETDDAAQFALLQLLRAAAHFRGDASLRHWARRVASRAVLKHRARLRRNQARETSLELLDEPELPSDDSGEHLPRSLPEYLAELPPEQGEVLVLYHALGYSITEIAERTKVSANTVKGRLRLAIKQLRRRVRQELLLGARRSAPVPG